MKKSNQSRRVQDLGQQAVQQPEKVGWIRKFCGRGIFRELWRNRYVILRGDQLYISDKEVKDEQKAQEVFDLADYERSEELRKAKSRSKKNHSRFTLLRCRQPGNTVPNLVFLAVSPEEKESWVNALNVAIIKAKNRILDEVTIGEDSALVHPTRDRAKIPHGRRLPTRGHLMAVASTSSHGMLTLDLVAEEDGFSPGYEGSSRDSWENLQIDLQRGGSCGQVAAVGSLGVRQRAGTDVSKLRVTSKESKVKTSSLPRGSELSWGKHSHLEVSKIHKPQQVQVLQAQSRTPQPGKRFSMQGRSRCASMDEVLSSRPAMIRSELRSALQRCPTEEEAGGGASVQPVGQLQSLIAQRMQRAQELLEEMRLQELQKAKAERERGGSSPYLKGIDSPRLHHLRGSDSPHSSRSSGSPRSRSSDSPRLRGKESPRLRGRESPRSKAKRNRSKGTESPRSRGSHSPAAKTNDSPRLKDSPCLNATNSPRTKSSDTVHSPKLKGSSTSSCPNKEYNSPVQQSHESPPSVGGSGSSQVKGSDSPQGSETDSPHLGNSKGSPCQSQKNSPSLSGSFESPQPKTPDKHRLSPPLPSSLPSLLSEDLEVERRREEAERLLEEAVSSWKEAQEVLQEVKELQSQTLRRQRRRTYEKMTTAAAAGLPTVTVPADEDDTPTSPTSPEEDDESETP
ncbi:pleckstrin homology domain-containing family O member 1-A-like isoform X1 [Epinephelus fuscoguttatus]|uniref:pleckstrin homology domain-containing family O member 1-A-like isoform X1 n=1 Tax=Epinephelus fuscoguttatus TaxID=293821 RepID=UPI0020D11FF4|nr:pleckstrin homology domain-containing family O member 1-A-like isoform X1 [Epinephelus fuscoguttatus]